MKKRASLKFFVASLFFFAIAKWLLPDISGLTEEAGDFVVGLGMFLGGSMLVLSLYMLALSRLHSITPDGQKIGVYNSEAEVKRIDIRNIRSVSAVAVIPGQGGRTGVKAYAEAWPAWNPMLRLELDQRDYYYLPITRHKREQDVVVSLLRTLQQYGVQVDVAVQRYLDSLGVPTSNLVFTNVIGSPVFRSRADLKKSMNTYVFVILAVLLFAGLLVWLAYENPTGLLSRLLEAVGR